MSGRVFLVGAGPGDPGLLTIKGQRCLAAADVVIYDYLADSSLLRFAPPAAERICVGKHGGGKRTGQEEINTLLVDRARQGKTVVRLKGGDPFIFGRGAEEAEELARSGIEFEVVPGVTSGTAVPAYAGIPLTHREYSSSVAFLAGYEYPDKAELAVPWRELARSFETLVLFMTTRQLRSNMERLIAAGLDPQTPAAVIRWGTKARQETIVGTVATIAVQAEERRLRPPALAVVGQVVRLRERIQWFERKPLSGRRIVVTRPRQQAARFAELLEDLGAEVLCFPTVELRPPESWQPLDQAIAAIESFDWIVFTSVNGVAAFLERFDLARRDLRDLKGIHLAAIGPETARALEHLHLRVDAVPEEYRAEGVLEALGEVSGRRILLPRAAGARDILPRELERRGAAVVETIAYRGVRPEAEAGELRETLEAGDVDMVTFTSSSTVRNFAEMFAPGEAATLLGRSAVGCIGPITGDTARQLGFAVAVQPARYTIPDFAEAIREYFASMPRR